MVRSKSIIISKIAGFIIDNRIISDYRSVITHFFFAKIFALNRKITTRRRRRRRRRIDVEIV